MSSFNGVSVVNNGGHCTTSAVNAGTDSGYHLFVVKDYSRTAQEVPNGVAIRSGPFVVGGHKWCIMYFPNSSNPSSADFMSLYIDRLDEDLEEAVEAKFQFTFVDELECQKPVYIRATETYNFSNKDRCRGSTKFIKRDALERSAYLKDDCFTIRCDIMVCNHLNTSKDAMPDIHDHFNNLLQNNTGADVTFEVSGELFTAHRCVLAARSKVFEAQLFGPMAEGTTSSAIQIKDMEAKVFMAMLRFIYTDAFPRMDIDNNTEGEEAEVVKQRQDLKYVMWMQDLFVAADRYDLERLKFLCENHLSELMCVSSAASTLALADRHHCHRLKEACFKFIRVQSPKCLDKVMETDDWNHMTTTYPSVLNEIIANLASNHQKKKKRKR